MIKAAFFDIDGTLVSFKTHKMSDTTKNCLRELQRKGIKVFISTGRPPSFINNLDDYPFDGYIITNGSLVLAGDEVIVDKPLDKDTCQKVSRICSERNIPAYVFMRNSFGINCMNEASENLKRNINTPEPDIIDIVEASANNPVYEFTVFMTQEQEDTLFHPVLGPVEYPRWHPTFMDVIPFGLSKAEGAAALLNHFGIKQEECIAFGDGGNDIPILEYAGIGVAMGNADDVVKSSADYVTTSVDDEGILAAFKHFGVL